MSARRFRAKMEIMQSLADNDVICDDAIALLEEIIMEIRE